MVVLSLVFLIKRILEKNYFSDISTWTVDDFRKVLPAIKTLTVNEMKSITNDVFMLLLNEIAETSGLDDAQKQAIIEKVKEINGGEILIHNTESYF